ncbi:uncharacterized protein N7469_002606 [Penicillium citrinum]|uniref:MARVEL domain-containing protein n=2 Tax=Penicillium TaxID=5073 RepID=A0A9W9TTP0_PENCI|nr:uncharacterized protein N7469_002606 [Penicillium citrinum]KAJ5241015.1 hypothetical protein N7469_002606 [Penicillium citrinum]KAJ5586012.1 hypothetical protein N7450_005799 [Penicillium hetheringtonii]
MPVISRLVSIPLRISEIAFGAVVAGVIGHFLKTYDEIQPWPQGRWIYTEVVAGISILFGLLWLIPFSSGFFSWPLDVLISFAWFAAFGLLVDTINNLPCGGIFDWNFFHRSNVCTRSKAAEAFAFLSAIVWLVSALVGIWFTFRKRDSNEEGTTRRRWGRKRGDEAA